ncbi:MAG TPA: MBL fold metallo-hydrolase [Burkholderiales bacterium]|nr:MBL fold metallo-hydrolase [Burkholderiales bacterium]
MQLTFLGAAGEVTGSCYLVDTGEIRFLIDCGMFQGGGEADRRNRSFAFDPRDIAFVLLSHAHIDHSGLLPRLVALGFDGAIYATRATADLLQVMLPDSAHLQEREAEHAEAGHSGRNRGAPPLYTVEHAVASLARLRPVEYDESVRLAPSVRCVFRDAGHILGSAILEIWLTAAGGNETKLVFSGDLGQPGRPIVRDPAPIAEADVLLVESTYGDRNHKSLAATLDEFAAALNETLATGKGNVVIPAFAVGRTQEILYFIAELASQGRIGSFAVYVDSPMALAATRVTLEHPEVLDRDAATLTKWLVSGKGKPRVHFTETLEDSMKINSIRSGAVIISASGMCEGGRIRHHLRYNLSRPECAIVFVGFQAEGTLGRRIVDGAATVRFFGEEHPVRAKVYTIGGLSAHADREALLGWLGGFRRPPRATWVVHGEPLAAHSLRDAIEERFGWRAAVPAPRQRASLASAG